jgi:hypothetical protein
VADKTDLKDSAMGVGTPPPIVKAIPRKMDVVVAVHTTITARKTSEIIALATIVMIATAATRREVLIDSLVLAMIIVQHALLMDKRDAILVDNASMIGEVHTIAPIVEMGTTISHSRNEATSDVTLDAMIVRQLATQTGLPHNVNRPIHAGRAALVNNVMPHETRSMSLTVARMMVASVLRVIMSVLKSAIRAPQGQ